MKLFCPFDGTRLKNKPGIHITRCACCDRDIELTDY